MPMEGRRDTPESALGVKEWLGIAEEEGFSNCIEEGARKRTLGAISRSGKFSAEK